MPRAPLLYTDCGVGCAFCSLSAPTCILDGCRCPRVCLHFFSVLFSHLSLSSVVSCQSAWGCMHLCASPCHVGSPPHIGRPLWARLHGSCFAVSVWVRRRDAGLAVRARGGNMCAGVLCVCLSVLADTAGRGGGGCRCDALRHLLCLLSFLLLCSGRAAFVGSGSCLLACFFFSTFDDEGAVPFSTSGLRSPACLWRRFGTGAGVFSTFACISIPFVLLSWRLCVVWSFVAAPSPMGRRGAACCCTLLQLLLSYSAAQQLGLEFSS